MMSKLIHIKKITKETNFDKIIDGSIFLNNFTIIFVCDESSVGYLMELSLCDTIPNYSEFIDLYKLDLKDTKKVIDRYNLSTASNILIYDKKTLIDIKSGLISKNKLNKIFKNLIKR